MESSNIERFDEIVGKAFAKLYQRFPEPVPLFVGAFMDEDKVRDKMSDFFTDEAKFCIYCLYWLRNAGYLCGDNHDFGLIDAVLTAKGLETLKAIPDSLNAPAAPLGERIVDAVKTESASAVRTVVNQVLSMGAQLLLR